MNRLLIMCGLCLGLSVVAVANETRQTEQQLERLRDQIKTLRSNLEKDLGVRDQLLKRLQEAEKEVSNIRSRINQLQQDQVQTQARLEELDQKLTGQKKQAQKKAGNLAAQLKAAYIGGRQQSLKFILNSDDPVNLARTMTYFGFFNRHRSQQIRAIQKEMTIIQGLNRQVSQTLTEQQRLKEESEIQLQAIQKARQARGHALADLEAKIANRDSEVQRLSREEKALVSLLAELKDLLSEYPVQTEQTFSSLRGELQWPLPGRLLHDFGQPRAARIPWRGVVVGAPAGTPIRAIARGRVSYADWLPGMGLLLILDHGGGFMSLYGYNQTLSKSLGDWVSPGDTLARVGDTGGQLQPSLYFEIRQSGKPLNPHKWFKSGIPQPRNPGAAI